MGVLLMGLMVVVVILMVVVVVEEEAVVDGAWRGLEHNAMYASRCSSIGWGRGRGACLSE